MTALKEHYCPKCDRTLPVSAFDRYNACNIKPYCRACGTKRGGGRNRNMRWRTARVRPGVEMSERELARALGMTRQGVRYILARALDKLRLNADGRGL